ncbi:hypothetical protein FGO68_gene8470 [Halteria grandinella]|uniref:AIG1-type G domain-containing protein n=1 Tax=Halteria grandinella TaxID=5974 RepID=A0A8J8NR80_HALGN|nr:hypothetical protein FGO68_gene8470 [Halteria grandinella]
MQMILQKSYQKIKSKSMGKKWNLQYAKMLAQFGGGVEMNDLEFQKVPDQVFSISLKNKELILVTFGPTRAGKSSFINKMANKHLARVGEDQGESTTTEVSIHTGIVKGCHLRLFDTPGLNDSKLRFSDKELQEKVKITLLEHSEKGQLDALLLFESCYSDSNQLRNTLNKAQQLFGTFFRKSAVVIFTKYVKGVKSSKIETLKDICDQNNVLYFLWENEDIEDQEMEEQKKSLLFLINNKLQPFDVTEVQKLQEKIIERALRLREETPKEQQREEFEFELKEIYFEAKKEAFNYTVNEIGWKRHGNWFWGICGSLEPHVIKTNKEFEYTVQVPKEEMRKHIMAKDVKIELPIEVFMQRARKQVLQELKQAYVCQ